MPVESLKSLQVAIDTWNDDGGQWLDDADRLLLDAQRMARDFAIRDVEFHKREELLIERERQVAQREQLLIERERLLTDGMMQLSRHGVPTSLEFAPMLTELSKQLEVMRTLLAANGKSQSNHIEPTALSDCEIETVVEIQQECRAIQEAIQTPPAPSAVPSSPVAREQRNRKPRRSRR